MHRHVAADVTDGLPWHAVGRQQTATDENVAVAASSAADTAAAAGAVKTEDDAC